jgi:PKD repeat protein
LVIGNVAILYESPTADFAYSPDPMIENQTTVFDASNSTAGSGTISEYAWDFGDGNSSVTSNPITSHVYESKGTYNITLTVQNTYGLNDTICKIRDVLRHDIAVTEVVPYRTWVYEGRLVRVNVTLLNCGDFNETVTLDLYYNLTANQQIGTIVTDLGPNETKTLTFEWNTLGVQHCHNYTVTAIANIQFDSNTTNNAREGAIRIKVRIMGDINGDGEVDMKDVVLAASAFGSDPNHPRWNSDADIDENGEINVKDIALVCKHFGECV